MSNKLNEIMTAKEKAKELVGKFTNSLYISNGTGAGGDGCALIAVDELINSYSQYTGMYDQDFFTSELLAGS